MRATLTIKGLILKAELSICTLTNKVPVVILIFHIAHLTWKRHGILWNPCTCRSTCGGTSEAYLEPCERSKMELFSENWLIILQKSSILDVLQGVEFLFRIIMNTYNHVHIF